MEHDSVHELTAAYALDALDDADVEAYEEHLAGCARCREELAALATTVGALAYAAPPADPPARLRGRILDAARAERPNVIPLAPRRSRRPGLLAAVAAVAACTAVGLGIWNVSLQNRLDEGLRIAQLQGASGSVVVDPEGRGVLVISNLRPAAAGKTYEAWIVRDGKAEPAGVFEGGDTVLVRLESAVPKGALVAVTVERAGGAPQPTTTPFITSTPL
jgi:anti-sigma-K factor RskA